MDETLGGGLLPNYLSALSGKMKGGKTTFMSALAFNLAKQGIKTGFMSLEMSPSKHLIPSLLSMAYEVNARRAPKETVHKLVTEAREAVPYLSNIRFYTRMGRTNANQIKHFIEHNHKVHDVRVFFLDHFLYALEDVTDRREISNLTKTLRK